jgi:hypothetical protein
MNIPKSDRPKSVFDMFFLPGGEQQALWPDLARAFLRLPYKRKVGPHNVGADTVTVCKLGCKCGKDLLLKWITGGEKREMISSGCQGWRIN